jgi:predicted MFS family arabinose efflux permease
MLGMVSFGIGEIVGAFFIGLIIEKLGNRFTSVYILVILTMQTVITLVFIVENEYSWLAFIMTFIWGF